MDERFSDPELIDERPDERLDTSRLEPYLRDRLPDTDGEMAVRQFGGGHANLTYLVCFGDREYVLRRPPLGPVAPSAHDMGRENRILSKLAPFFHLAPMSYLYCEDDSIIGAPFQVMERRHGIAIRKVMPESIAADHALVRRIGEMVVDVLADLHLVDRAAAGLDGLGRPEGFVGRQLEGWAKRWEAAAHVDNARMDALVAWLRERLPGSDTVTLIHNDYKLDNMLLAADDPARAVAILDWDMCTSGDPLMDLGYLLNQWVESDDPRSWIEESAMPTDQPGFADRDAVVERYAARTGFDATGIDWYHAFAAMKFAAVIQQIFIRYHRGQTRDERFARYDERAVVYIEKGCAIAGL